VRPEWLDYNGHMNDSSYAVVLSAANEQLFEELGLSADYRARTGAALYTVETTIRFLAECTLGQTLSASTTVVEADAKKLRVHTELLHEDGRPAATGDCLYLHVDSTLGRVTPMPAELRARVEEMLAAPADGTPRVVTPYEGTGHLPWDDAADIEAPLRLHRTSVSPEWVDYNGHMSESCYLLVFGDCADAFFRYLGVDEAYREAGHSLYTAETHLHHRREVHEGAPLEVTLQLLDHDPKRVHVFMEMWHGDSRDLLATAEQLLVHVDMAAGRSAPLPAALAARLDAIQQAHAALPRPSAAGKPMGIRHA
jgi:carnitine 3-dehydrogenase